MSTSQGYRIVDREQASTGGRLTEALARSLVKDGQNLLPIVELIAQGRAMVDEVIDSVGRASVQFILEMSADQVAGERHQGKRDDRGVHRFGSQPGIVPLSDRTLRVKRPRVRTKAGPNGKSKEVPLPAYEAMRSHQGVAEKMMSILARGVSTRDYKGALRDMAGTVGVSKSQVSREFIEKTEKAHDELMARSFEGVNILVIYLDGMAFGDHHVITALGIDDAGGKRVLGIQHGTSENAAAVKALLQGLVERGVKPGGGMKRLFIVDGGKALRAGINEVYGSENPVQRCTIHKVRNVVGHLPKDRATYARMVMGAAFKMEQGQGMGKLKELARDLEHDHPAAAASLLEGLDEMFTVSRMGLPGELARSLRSTNIIESPQSLIAKFSGRVKNWQDPRMVLRWHAAASLEAEKRMHRVGGAKHLWMLEQALGREGTKNAKVA